MNKKIKIFFYATVTMGGLILIFFCLTWLLLPFPKDDFLNYDYIGAPYPLPQDNFSYRDIDGNLIRVGNSVSLRSKKLLDLPIQLDLEWISETCSAVAGSRSMLIGSVCRSGWRE